MIKIASATKIFLSEERGIFKNEQHKLFCTFNHQSYSNEHKTSFGHFQTWNDEILNENASITTHSTVNGYIIFLPVIGALEIQYLQHSITIEAGQLTIIPTTNNQPYIITNPYPEDWVNFLQIEICSDNPISDVRTIDFDIINTVNKLFPIVKDNTLPFNLHIGRFAGRTNIIHTTSETSKIFAFVIGGAFEFQNCLLNERDGLALQNINTIDAESLSNGATLLLLEII